MRRKKRYVSRGYAKRKRKRIFLIVITIIIIAAALGLIIKPAREKLLSLPPFPQIQGWWQQLIDPEKDSAQQAQSEITNLETIAPSPSASPSSEANAVASTEALSDELLDLDSNYHFEVRPDIQDGIVHMDIIQQITFSNTGSSSLQDVLLILPDASVNFTMTQIVAEGQNLLDQATSEGERQLRIPLSEPLVAGASLRLTLGYEINLAQGTGLPSYNGRSIFAANFYPALASRDDAKWIADELVQTAISAKFSASIHPFGSEYTLAAGGQKQKSASQSSDLILYNSENNPAFAFAAGSDMRSGSISASNTTVDFYFYHTGKVTSWSGQFQPALDYLVGLFGDYAQPIAVFEGALESQCEANGGMVFVDESWVEQLNQSNERLLLTEISKLYLAPAAHQDLWLYGLLSRYIGQNYGRDYQEILENQASAAEDGASGILEQPLPDGLPGSSESPGITPEAEVIGNPEPIPQIDSTLPEGLDGDVFELMNFRQSIGTESFDAALKRYAQAAGEKSFTECFDADKQAMVHTWLEYYHG